MKGTNAVYIPPSLPLKGKLPQIMWPFKAFKALKPFKAFNHVRGNPSLRRIPRTWFHVRGNI